jgi:hypothetical protein
MRKIAGHSGEHHAGLAPDRPNAVNCPIVETGISITVVSVRMRAAREPLAQVLDQALGSWFPGPLGGVAGLRSLVPGLLRHR